MISIIVPTLNEEQVLARCLQSLNSQSYAGEKEVIVSDGYSKDSTAKIAKGMGAR